MNKQRILYIHGSDSTGQTYKAQVLKSHYPRLVSPDFTGSLANRVFQVASIIKDQSEWTIIGSSLGGLVAAIYTAEHPDLVCKLILLSPALHFQEFTRHLPKPIHVPTIIITGKHDIVIPIRRVESIASKVFKKLKIISVDDAHRLHHTAETINWDGLLL